MYMNWSRLCKCKPMMALTTDGLNKVLLFFMQARSNVITSKESLHMISYKLTSDVNHLGLL